MSGGFVSNFIEDEGEWQVQCLVGELRKLVEWAYSDSLLAHPDHLRDLNAIQRCGCKGFEAVHWVIRILMILLSFSITFLGNLPLIAFWNEKPCTRSGDGVTVLNGGARIDVPVKRIVPVDATGAGDQFAAGFLYGMATGHDYEACARFGNVCAREVISHIGPRPEVDMIKLLRNEGLL